MKRTILNGCGDLQSIPVTDPVSRAPITVRLTGFLAAAVRMSSMTHWAEPSDNARALIAEALIPEFRGWFESDEAARAWLLKPEWKPPKGWKNPAKRKAARRVKGGAK